MEKRNVIQELTIIFWIFILGSIMGYILEMIVALVQNGYFESRQGLIYGPFTPVYGVGAILYYLMLKDKQKESKVKIFFWAAVFGGIVEYLCSYMQEKLFGTVSWDYSHLWFNINGRTSLLHCTYWGMAGVLYITYVQPLLYKMQEKLNVKNLKFITLVLSVFMFFNISISYVAANRQTERRNNIGPESSMDLFLDKYYPDEYMDKIYANKKER